MSAWINLVKYFVIKDIKAKYAGSGLGLLWTFLMPVMQIAIYWFVFSAVMRVRPYTDTTVPYIYFLLSSFFFWLAFSEGLMRASTSITENADMVKKVSFSNMVLPVSVTFSSYLHHLVGFGMFVVVYGLSGSLHPSMLLVAPVLLLQICLSLGLGLMLSALMPYVRDLGQLMGYALQGLFFLSPIIYSMEAIPERFRVFFYMNPVTYFTSSYHRIILSREMPQVMHLAVMGLLSVTALAGGLFIFNKLKEGFSDVL